MSPVEVVTTGMSLWEVLGYNAQTIGLGLGLYVVGMTGGIFWTSLFFVLLNRKKA